MEQIWNDSRQCILGSVAIQWEPHVYHPTSEITVLGSPEVQN